MRWLVVALAIALTGCGAAPSVGSAPLRLTIGGATVLDLAGLQTRAEAEVGYTLDFGYAARVSKDPVTCWFARTDLETEVDTRLWCGPVQV
ncbi:hypothetical protein, partial [Actinosynnema sp. NPDC020468]|uniref:hypothetical protein n=1 Tax=Actinosynnema sp. NPDC020468 TaxID=3154488 RepID=UPI0033EDFB86